MAYKIAIASGKGGTGKTTVSVNLFHLLNQRFGGKVQLVDCDIEEPNDVLFFPGAEKTMDKDVFQLIPVIDTEKCSFCRKCATWCAFNAIVVIPPVQFAEVNASLCHSCGACSVACPENAISEKPEPVGKITEYNANGHFKISEGRLHIGSAMQTMLIRELKKQENKDQEIVIYDAPPGTSCPVVETVSDADYVILVTEPTPFGLSDLRLMVDLLQELGRTYGVVINKAGLGSPSVYDYLKKTGIELLGEIPFSESYAASYAAGNLFEEIPNEVTLSYQPVIEKLEQKILVHEGNNCH
ncbi:MAG TPA: ATP-binding protein [Bacteroidales bacterium]|nr:ATP-binding protein [Bacteroidales bacterium]